MNTVHSHFWLICVRLRVRKYFFVLDFGQVVPALMVGEHDLFGLDWVLNLVGKLREEALLNAMLDLREHLPAKYGEVVRGAAFDFVPDSLLLLSHLSGESCIKRPHRSE